MAKVLLINPVVRQEDDPKHVPYGIALLAAIAMDRGHLVQVYDANAWRKDLNIIKEICAADDWDVVGLGGMTTTYGSIKEIVAVIRESVPASTQIILGGGILTSLPREMMDFLPAVDLGVVGEAFETFPEILDMCDSQKQAWSDIPGLVYRGKNGEIEYSPPRELIPDLDVLPYPAWDLFPLEEIYFKNSALPMSEEGMLSRRRLDINASYGCSLICRYCYHLGIAGDMRYVKDEDGKTQVEFDQPGKYTRKTRYHSAEYVVKMVKHLYDKYEIDLIGFLDENLMTMHRYSRDTWLTDICRLWHEYDLVPKWNDDKSGWSGVHWGGTSHASLCNLEILKTMRNAGCAHLVYGYESFAPHVLKTVGKGATVKHNIQSFFWTLEAGIRPIPNLIIGFPNEDFESVRANVAAWDRLGIMVIPHFATAYPGSEWFTVNRQSIEDQYDGDLESFILDLGDARDISAVISINFNAVELVGIREMMVQKNSRRIDEYEMIWRKSRNIPDGMPSTLCPPRLNKKAG
jgi:radical SAM superfamily enzyme YgiQ (UPF0313 family)